MKHAACPRRDVIVRKRTHEALCLTVSLVHRPLPASGATTPPGWHRGCYVYLGREGTMRRLTCSLTVAALALVPACKGRSSDPEETQKVIEETKEAVAQTRIDIDEKQEQVIEQQGEVSGDRNEFIARTQAELDDLDRRIQELRGQVEQRAQHLDGEAQREVRMAMTDLENARDASRDALERFRQSTTPRSVEIKQAVERALGTLRNAYDQVTGRLEDRGRPGRDALRITPVPPPAVPSP